MSHYSTFFPQCILKSYWISEHFQINSILMPHKPRTITTTIAFHLHLAPQFAFDRHSRPIISRPLLKLCIIALCPVPFHQLQRPATPRHCCHRSMVVLPLLETIRQKENTNNPPPAAELQSTCCSEICRQLLSNKTGLYFHSCTE